jgi:CRP-like cAMP-binding protein
VDFPAGTFIFRHGDVGDRFYIVRDGAVQLAKPGDAEPADPPLTEGAFFGERALMKDNTRRVCGLLLSTHLRCIEK